MGELSRTLALAVRLFGNLMGHEKGHRHPPGCDPLFFPVVMQALGLLIGVIQAISSRSLTMVYIASATQMHEETEHKQKESLTNPLMMKSKKASLM